MNIREIVKKYLEENGYDGLGGDMCSCEKDDLMPCDNPQPTCFAGYFTLCPGGDECSADGNCKFHISKEV